MDWFSLLVGFMAGGTIGAFFGFLTSGSSDKEGSQ